MLVDANDGVQAQTVANFYLAFGKDLIIIPVLNKIDLKNADPVRVCNQLNNLFDIDSKDVLQVCAFDTLLRDTKISKLSLDKEKELFNKEFKDCFYYCRSLPNMVLVLTKCLKL